MEERINYVNLILGRRGSGKTYTMKENMEHYAIHRPEMKQLTMDTLDHPAYRHLATITPPLIRRWLPEARGKYRVYGSNTAEAFAAIESSVYNAHITFEDASKYIRRQLTDDVRNFIIDSKQKNLDLSFMFHGFGYVPPEMWRIVDTVTIFNTDNPAKRKEDIMCYDEVYEAWQEVRNSGNPYAKKTVMIY